MATNNTEDAEATEPPASSSGEPTLPPPRRGDDAIDYGARMIALRDAITSALAGVAAAAVAAARDADPTVKNGAIARDLGVHRSWISTNTATPLQHPESPVPARHKGESLAAFYRRLASVRDAIQRALPDLVAAAATEAGQPSNNALAGQLGTTPNRVTRLLEATSPTPAAAEPRPQFTVTVPGSRRGEHPLDHWRRLHELSGAIREYLPALREDAVNAGLDRGLDKATIATWMGREPRRFPPPKPRPELLPARKRTDDALSDYLRLSDLRAAIEQALPGMLSTAIAHEDAGHTELAVRVGLSLPRFQRYLHAHRGGGDG